MKKLLNYFLLFCLGFLGFSYKAFAQVTTIVLKPPQGIDPDVKSVNQIYTTMINVVFAGAVVTVLFFILWGAFEWMLSGGDKDKTDKARKRIIAALIGLALVASAFLIVNLAATFLGLSDITKGISIPTLGPIVTQQAQPK